ncbi:glutathione s-transferase [Lasius niger]|uniref:Glutathione s-transferase n=1 Tax=Lasius niger TaxID=67767 RepID=A0A0J7MXZ4_LASNI|nr:glutathione s-transferase [Lasius niger]
MILAYAKEKTGLAYEAIQVDLTTHQTEQGEDYYKINPRGAVPALEIDLKGQKRILTQNHAILLYIGAVSGIPALNPEKDSFARARLDEALSFCSDLHASYSPLLHPEKVGLESSQLAGFYQKAERRLRELENWLPEKGFWLGEEFTQPDAYAAVILAWSERVKIDLSPYPKAKALKEKVFALSAVKTAFNAEKEALG